VLQLLTLFLLLTSATFSAASRKSVCKVTAEAVENFHLTMQAINDHQAENREAWGYDSRYEQWPVDGDLTVSGKPSPSMQYNFYFQAPLEGKTFEQYASARLKEGKTAHVADLFGSAVFSQAPDAFSSLTGVRLKKLDPTALPGKYPAANWGEVEGDLYRPDAWKTLRNDMKRRDIPSFDIIICRPEGPLKQLSRAFLRTGQTEENRAAFFHENLAFLNQAYRNLSTEDGRMFLQLTPEINDSPEFNAWLSRVRKKNIQAEVFMNITSFQKPVPLLRIARASKSSDTLPE